MLAELSQIQRYGHAVLPIVAASEAARQRLQRITGPSPRVFCFGAFECRLDTLRGDVDFAACLRGGEARSALRAMTDWPLVWHRSVLERWVDPNSRLSSTVKDIWFEFDLDAADPPQPFLHFALAPTRGEEVLHAVRTILDDGIVETGSDGAKPARDQLMTCASRLPESAAVMLVASLAHRQAHRLRMSAALVANDIPGYLQAISWPGRAQACRDWLEGLGATDWKSVPLQIDVTPSGVAGRISLEFVAPTSVDTDPRWRRVLNQMVERGLCLPDWLPHLEHWSEGIHSPASIADGVIQVGRHLNIKLSLDPGQEPRAKAYLGFWPRIVLLH